jgi:hypothetical protein
MPTSRTTLTEIVVDRTIRVSDALFRRLQALGEPLVDTPADVIERLLDAFNARAREMPSGPARSSEPHPPRRESGEEEMTQRETRKPGLFLAPADSDNLRVSLTREVPLSTVRDALTPSQVALVERVASSTGGFRCWAMTETRRALFKAMVPNDIVLFTEKGTGMFGYSARVIAKLESQQLGERLWRVVPRLPWKLIYFLDSVQCVRIPKSALVRALNFSPNYQVQGILRVTPEKLQVAIGEYGSLATMLQALAK